MNDKLAEEVIIFILTRDLEELAKLTSEMIAAKFEVDEHDLLKKFKKDTQVTLEDYIESAQVHQAAELLKEKKDLGMIDIMRMVGLEKKHRFTRKFEKILGIDPYRYRDLFIESKEPE